MAIVLILLSLLLACTLVVALELVRLFSSSSRAELPEMKAKFAGPDRYRPMERLFAEEDFRFLKQRRDDDRAAKEAPMLPSSSHEALPASIPTRLPGSMERLPSSRTLQRRPKFRHSPSTEANAHDAYKQKIMAASEEETVRTTLFGNGWPNAYHRTLRTPFVEQWLPEEKRGSEERPDEPVVGEVTLGLSPGRRSIKIQFEQWTPCKVGTAVSKAGGARGSTD